MTTPTITAADILAAEAAGRLTAVAADTCLDWDSDVTTDGTGYPSTTIGIDVDGRTVSVGCWMVAGYCDGATDHTGSARAESGPAWEVSEGDGQYSGRPRAYVREGDEGWEVSVAAGESGHADRWTITAADEAQADAVAEALQSVIDDAYGDITVPEPDEETIVAAITAFGDRARGSIVGSATAESVWVRDETAEDGERRALSDDDDGWEVEIYGERYAGLDHWVVLGELYTDAHDAVRAARRALRAALEDDDAVTRYALAELHAEDIALADLAD